MNSTKRIVRREFLTCRVSKEEKALIQSNADSENKDVSTYVREILLPIIDKSA